jgi:hypothetical protein
VGFGTSLKGLAREPGAWDADGVFLAVRDRSAGRWSLKTWERIAELAKELPPETQRQVQDYVEFLRAREGEGEPAAGSTPSVPPAAEPAATSWPGIGFGPGSDPGSWNVERTSDLDPFHTPPPRRRGGQIAIGIVFAAVVGAVGA